MKVNIGKYPKNGNDRKVKVEISSHDTYSLDSTLAEVIYPALEKFKEERLKMPGVPYKFFEEGDPKNEHGNHTDEAVEIAEKRYLDAIDKMIWAFKEIAKGFPGELEYIKENGKEWKTEPCGKEGFSKIVETGYDIDTNKIEEYYNKIDEGTDLFGKNIRSLWW